MVSKVNLIISIKRNKTPFPNFTDYSEMPKLILEPVIINYFQRYSTMLSDFISLLNFSYPLFSPPEPEICETQIPPTLQLNIKFFILNCMYIPS